MPYRSLPVRRIYNPSVYQLEYRTVQPKPYLLAAPYYLKRNMYIAKSGSLKDRDPSSNWSYEERADVSRIAQHAYNKAYARFVAKLGSTSSFGATLTAERRESYNMIRGFIVSLFQSANAARRGNIPGVLNALKFSPPIVRVPRTYIRRRKKIRVVHFYYRMPDRRLVEKKAASAWLLWSYGVSPLLSDIQNATDVFLRAVPAGQKVFGRATESVKIQRTQNNVYNNGTYIYESLTGSIKAGIDAHVVCENYDLWLLNQLGMVNPVQFVNEAVPFSFVIDWCSNWSQVIMSLSDFVGLTFTRSSNSTLYKLQEFYLIRPVKVTQSNANTIGSYHTDFLFFNRSVGIPQPKLQFRYEAFEWRRALNAISLLVGFLPKSHKN